MFAPGAWDSRENLCDCSFRLLKSVVPLIDLFPLLVIFFYITLVIFSYVSLDEKTTISSCVAAAWMPYAGHILEVFKFPRLKKSFGLVCHRHGIVWSALFVVSKVFLILSPRVLSVV
jgi:hypothetical protein